MNEDSMDEVLTEDDSDWLERLAGRALVDLTEGELGKLANHYLDRSRNIEWFWQVDGGDSLSGSEVREALFAEAQLEALRRTLGDDQFERVTAETAAKWERKFAEADAAERSLPPCLVCGVRRTFAIQSLVGVSSLDERICQACGLEVEMAESRPCESCGGPRSHREKLCEACIDRKIKRSEATPCPSCGEMRVMSDYTGDLCWKCAEERLAPCVNCGGRRELGPYITELCGPCRVNRHFNFTEVGGKVLGIGALQQKKE